MVGMVVRWAAIRKYVFESEFYPDTICVSLMLEQKLILSVEVVACGHTANAIVSGVLCTQP